jgi:hypothetical protein
MKKLTGLLVLTAALLLALPTPRAGAVAPPAGTFFLCVNTTAKPPLPNARVVNNTTSCLPFEYLVTLTPGARNLLSSEFQNESSGVGEISTTLAPLAGGLGGVSTYSKTLSIPFDVVFVTFSAQGDTHGGASLSMSANITNSLAATTVCQPMAGATTGGGGTAGPSGWMTLNKLPTSALPNNCNDGSGGSADCHDNGIMFSCCVRITPDNASTKHTVEIRLGSQPNPLTPAVPGTVFYERSTIYIEAASDPGGSLCSGVGTANH